MKEIDEKSLSKLLGEVAGTISNATGLNENTLAEGLTDLVVSGLQTPYVNMENKVYVAGDKMLAYAAYGIIVEGRNEPLLCFQVSRLLSPMTETSLPIKDRLAYDTTKIIFTTPEAADDLVALIVRTKQRLYDKQQLDEVPDGNS